MCLGLGLRSFPILGSSMSDLITDLLKPLNGGLLQVCSTPAAGVRVVAGRGSAVRRAEGGLLALIYLQAQGGSGDGASPRSACQLPQFQPQPLPSSVSPSGWQAAPSGSTPCSCRWSICSSTRGLARWLARCGASCVAPSAASTDIFSFFSRSRFLLCSSCTLSRFQPYAQTKSIWQITRLYTPYRDF